MGGASTGSCPFPTIQLSSSCTAPHYWQCLRRPSNLLIQNSTLNSCAPRGTAHIWVSSHSGQVCPEGPFPIRHKQRKGSSRDLGAGRGGSKLFLPRRAHTSWYQGRHLSLEVLLEKLTDRGRDGHGSMPRAHLWRTPLLQRAGAGGGT